MRLAIFTSQARQGFAAALAWQLTRDGHTVGAIVVKRRSQWRRRREGARGAGRAMAQWFARSLGRTLADASLTTYAHAHGVPHTLPSLARRVGAALVRCDSFAAPSVLQALQAHPLDAAFHTGDGPLRPTVLALCGQGVARCHVGALPRLRGSDGLAWSMLRGEPLELCCQWLSTGAVLLRCPVPLAVGDSLDKLRARVEPLRVEALRDLARQLREGGLRAEVPMSEDEGKEHYPMHPRLLALAAARLK